MTSGAFFPQLQGCWQEIYEVDHFKRKFSLIVFGHQASVEMQEMAMTVKFWG